MESLGDSLYNFWLQTGFSQLNLGYILMVAIGCLLIWLAIKKGFEPLLLVPIGFGMLLVNLPGSGIMDGPVIEVLENGLNQVTTNGGLLYYLYQGDALGLFPPIIFMGVGAMTDFGPLIANPKSLLLGAAAQLGVYITFWGCLLFGFTPQEAASIGIIGGADGPTAIYLATKMAPHLLGTIAVAAYSYMALVPIIIPPVAKLFTTKKQRQMVMTQLKPVTKQMRLIFAIMVTIVVSLALPSAAPLIGMLMLGNLFKECGVCDRLSDTAQNALMNIVTIFLGTTVGATTSAESFLNIQTLEILLMGLVAFAGGTAGGVILAHIMNIFSKDKVNPLIGAAGVSAVPMASRVVQKIGQQENPRNFLLMHAMGPNVAGVIGTAVAAGTFLALFA